LSDGAEGEAALERLQEQACKLETEIWAKPAKTLTDLLLRAEIALHNENGVMDALNNPDAYYDDLANAQLIRAVLDVLGGANAL
jgi:DNA topoisomerase IA